MVEMSGWVLFFEVVGVSYCVSWIMRFVLWLDRGCK